ncbi:HpcH/HpaI aldolase/citrate lyase family protein [Acinetobacter courvalinii]|uniref:HpcH/HpaI aldolase/citrate lyase family protein n=1 Tax=Acinetobacter courvalinii TaxID=280147 RepID=A0AA42I662_9GAMM|nr:HpcH/HpaI aldolase/citrate lyase family protein [Acinetobacter courvalinii]MDH0563254.1 HpcH/HpaI aldolase/citrate lyase family protein [Acinetobacter courvalinii]
MLSALSLGATLYMPATRPDLWAVVKGEKYPELRSLVICLEDAITEPEIEFAKQNLKQLLQQIQQQQRLEHHPRVFIRPRHIAMAAELAEWNEITALDGMVLPKFGLGSFKQWLSVLPADLHYMPTLETADSFDIGQMKELRQALPEFHNVLVLRVGGNDLLNCLALRRPTDMTLYQTPVGTLIANLAGQFLPYGFALSAPVCEHFSQVKLLQDELYLDLQHGLSGKTVIHPAQISIVHQAYQVNEIELKQAQGILLDGSKAVFACHGSMLEPATHRRWAERILERARVFGLKV